MSKFAQHRRCPSVCAGCRLRCHRKATGTVEPAEAVRILFEEVEAATHVERVPLAQALGRVTARDVLVGFDYPDHRCNIHDGLLVNVGECEAYFVEDGRVRLPRGAFERKGMHDLFDEGRWDAIVPLEICTFEEDGSVTLERLPLKGSGMAEPGSYVRRGDVLVPKGFSLIPCRLQLLALMGVAEVDVLAKPRVGIFAVGDDLVPLDAPLAPGQVHEANTLMLAGVVRECGGEAELAAVAPDDPEAIAARLEELAARCDMVVVTGGLGRFGEEYAGDCTVAAIERVGVVYQVGVAIGPGGKCALVGSVDGTPVLGMPGPPHACVTVGEVVVPLAMQRFLGVYRYGRPTVTARVENAWKKLVPDDPDAPAPQPVEPVWGWSAAHGRVERRASLRREGDSFVAVLGKQGETPAVFGTSTCVISTDDFGAPSATVQLLVDPRDIP